MRVFITGASGYAGYYAALRFAAAGHRVTGMVRNTASPRLDLLRMHEIAILAGDVMTPDTYRATLEDSDVVIHAMFDRNNPIESDRVFLAALAALPEHPGTRRRFIYTTGNSIFGKLDVPVMDETTEPNPKHPLAFRRTLELEALALTNVGTVVVRPGFMYGDDGHSNGCRFWFFMAAGNDAVYRGDREKGWSWVHIDDLAEAYLLVAEADRSIDGEVFHLADEARPRSVDVMRAALSAAGYAGTIRFADSEPRDPFSTWFDQNEFITSAKARRMLGWIPRHHGVIEDMPAAYAAWRAAQARYAAGQAPA
jgi:nucleoside-diphosphate-sugar epimerase